MNKEEVTFTLVYSYSGNYGTGYTLTTQTNAIIEVILTRDQYRRHQMTDVVTEFNASEIAAHSYGFDALGRATNAVRSVQALSLLSTNVYAYNARSEVIGAGIDTNDYAYFYDNIGNNLYTSLNAITNAYTINNLNQYKAITNLLDLSGFRLGHDADGNTTLIDNQVLSYDAENRLSAYTFGLGSETGMLRSAYSYDYLGRRVKKLNQESKIKNPGGFIPLTYWHTNEVATYVYDGWNLLHESTALTNGTTQETSYFWGKDISGTLQGAGGVGGLLAVSIAGEFYFPCYDNNGNITAYIDESGSIIAYRVFDAFGNTVAKGGALVDTLHYWYSTKYLDHDTGLYYYGYRYYSPKLQRWINRDPIEEDGGLNLYGFAWNSPSTKLDYLGKSVLNYPIRKELPNLLPVIDEFFNYNIRSYPKEIRSCLTILPRGAREGFVRHCTSSCVVKRRLLLMPDRLGSYITMFSALDYGSDLPWKKQFEINQAIGDFLSNEEGIYQSKFLGRTCLDLCSNAYEKAVSESCCPKNREQWNPDAKGTKYDRK